ncbi:RagB/SusD family nutrient uptake outer membrane protein [Ancylomarina sp. YFZ004]
MKKINIYIALLLAAFSFSACDNYLDVKPNDRLIPTTVDDFRDLLTSAYNGIPSDKAKTTFRSDELKLDESKYDLSPVQDIFLWNDVNYKTNTLPFSWKAFYKIIMYTNHIIDAGVDATEGTDEEVNQIVAEAYLLRAYMHFSLVNQYGKPYNVATSKTDKGVPLSLVIDTEAVYFPNTVEEVYTQVLSDIAEADKRINIDTYEEGLNYRFSRVAAFAFKSRVYLYMGDTEKSREMALEALKLKSDLQDLVADNSLAPHKYNSVESILALEKVFTDDVGKSSLASEKLKATYVKESDLRFDLYFKEKENTAGEYTIEKGWETDSKCTFRTSELYLTVAESAARLDDLDQARTYLNNLKAKRLKPDFYTTEVARVAAMKKAELIDEIMTERLREFAFEGHRWFDLRRTTQPEITHIFNGETSTLIQGDPRYTLPFPQDAIINNPNLLD